MKIFLFLFRHGSTAGNTIKRYIGATDEELCDTGIAEIEAERKLLLDSSENGLETERKSFRKIIAERKKIYVSPMTRVKQTAKILFPENPVQIVDGFKEMSFGAFEGKNAAEMDGTPLGELFRQWVDSGCEGKCPDGEIFAGEDKIHFSERICSALIALSRAEKWQDGEIVPIVCHGGTINALLERFAVRRKGYFEWRTAHGAYRFEEAVL